MVKETKQTKARTETLLRRLAQTGRKDNVRLRAIELLLMLEGRLKARDMSKAETGSLSDLMDANPAETADKAE